MTTTRRLPALMLLLASLAPLGAQDRLKALPVYAHYATMAKAIPTAMVSGAVTGTWSEDGTTFTYKRGGKTWQFEVAKKVATEAPEAKVAEAQAARRRGGPERGRQFNNVVSPDGKLKAYSKDRNFFLSGPNGENEVALTTDANEKNRVKYGVASWVYGEELNQGTAMWWSPDSRKVAFYRFDESQVPDFWLQMDQTKVKGAVDIEAYPKAGFPNPVADLCVYDLEAKQLTKVDVRDGKPFENMTMGHYVFNVRWSPDGKELFFNRTTRRQNVTEFAAADPTTGKVRVVVTETWEPSWAENSPGCTFLKDGQRFIWVSERTGFKNFYLYDLKGTLLATLTDHPFEVANIVKVDEAAKVLYYMARSGDNPMKLQLHRVGLDGKKDVRLTDPAFHHTVTLAPDGKHFLDVAQTHKDPPVTRLLTSEGKFVAEVAKSDLTAYDKLGLKRSEVFTFKAADGVTDLYGKLSFPSTFDPTKKYPLLVSVYAGPATNGASESFSLPSSLTELGFLVANLDSRSAAGRGKRFLDAIYQKLGTVEIDDQAAGVKALRTRPYVDGTKVGIQGTSYGGYASLMALLRHPDVFQAACANSSVTSWYHYDSIYTERYMWIPQENKEGYEAGNAMNLADKLKGRLMIYYGTADNNVHPNNSMELIQALQKAGKSFEVQVGPDRGHTAVGTERMMEFFFENLKLTRPM